MKTGKKPKEDPSVIALRERQINDLAKLDEEQNRRLKVALNNRGSRAFRRAASSSSGGGSVSSRAGTTGAAAYSVAGGGGKRAAGRLSSLQ